uniref:DNAJ-containing protein X-domain domain-containing protein n=1 Tax=Prymnesium polylepis TaxID=72548 RepID=A0A7S4MHI9_9EUKA
MAETIWRFSLQDIEATLRQVCNRVLSDSAADVRTKRARGLVVMGRVFRSYGTETLKLEPTDIEKHFANVGQQFAKAHAEKMHAQDDAMYGKK